MEKYNSIWKSKKTKQKTKRINNIKNKMKSEKIDDTFMKNKSFNYLETKTEKRYQKNKIAVKLIVILLRKIIFEIFLGCIK